MNRLMLTTLVAALAYEASIPSHPDLDGERDYRKERQDASAKNAEWQLQKAAEKRARKAQKLARAFAPNA